MGIHNYECVRCRGQRCARYEATDPAYPQSATDADGERCTAACGGGQNCWEQTTVLVPQRLLAVAGRRGGGKGVMLTLPRVIPACYDGYHHYAVAPPSGGLRQTLTSGGRVVPASKVAFTDELWRFSTPEDCAAALQPQFLQQRGPKYLVLVKAWCRSCWEKEEREHPGVAAAAAGGSSSADADGDEEDGSSGNENDGENEDKDDGGSDDDGGVGDEKGSEAAATGADADSVCLTLRPVKQATVEKLREALDKRCDAFSARLGAADLYTYGYGAALAAFVASKLAEGTPEATSAALNLKLRVALGSEDATERAAAVGVLHQLCPPGGGAPPAGMQLIWPWAGAALQHCSPDSTADDELVAALIAALAHSSTRTVAGGREYGDDSRGIGIEPSLVPLTADERALQLEYMIKTAAASGYLRAVDALLAAGAPVGRNGNGGYEAPEKVRRRE